MHWYHSICTGLWGHWFFCFIEFSCSRSSALQVCSVLLCPAGHPLVSMRPWRCVIRSSHTMAKVGSERPWSTEVKVSLSGRNRNKPPFIHVTGFQVFKRCCRKSKSKFTTQFLPIWSNSLKLSPLTHYCFLFRCCQGRGKCQQHQLPHSWQARYASLLFLFLLLCYDRTIPLCGSSGKIAHAQKHSGWCSSAMMQTCEQNCSLYHDDMAAFYFADPGSE